MLDNIMDKRSEEIYSDLEHLLEAIRMVHEKLALLIKEGREQHEVDQMVSNIDNIWNVLQEHSMNLTSRQDDITNIAIAANLLISSGQSTPLICKLPHHDNPPEYFYKGYICQKDPRHVFCRKHQLSRCVLCGGVLK